MGSRVNGLGRSIDGQMQINRGKEDGPSLLPTAFRLIGTRLVAIPAYV
jgi:hypothetical protein